MATTQHEHHAAPTTPFGLSRSVKIALLMAVLIGGFFLLREHWNHVAGNWVYLVLLACPLMHLFHGHGGHGGDGAREDRQANRTPERPE